VDTAQPACVQTESLLVLDHWMLLLWEQQQLLPSLRTTHPCFKTHRQTACLPSWLREWGGVDESLQPT
jgi:hypothetical protein